MYIKPEYVETSEISKFRDTNSQRLKGFQRVISTLISPHLSHKSLIHTFLTYFIIFNCCSHAKMKEKCFEAPIFNIGKKNPALLATVTMLHLAYK